MRKPLLVIAILAVAWTTMDAAAVPFSSNDMVTTLAFFAIGIVVLAVLIYLWLRK